MGIANEIFEHTFYKVIYIINRDQYDFEIEFSTWVCYPRLNTSSKAISDTKKVIKYNIGHETDNFRQIKQIVENCY